MPRSNLVVVHAGDASLHPQWLTSKDRTWDLVVIFAGTYAERYLGQYDHLYRHSGSKWVGITDFLSIRSDFVQQYEYVWFPDDDLLTTGRNIDGFFELCKALRLSVAQPALTPYSHYLWEITVEQPTLLARITNFVEAAAPCFKVETLEIFSAIFGENSSGSGYEFVWSYLADQNGYLRRGIVDRTPVFRTRPIGSLGVSADLTEEGDRLLQKYGKRRFTPCTFQEIPWAGFS